MVFDPHPPRLKDKGTTLLRFNRHRMKKTRSDVSPGYFRCVSNHNKVVIYKIFALDINKLCYKTWWCNSFLTHLRAAELVLICLSG